MKPRAGLVLTGGGARAAYQVGVVKAVRDILGNPAQEPVPDPVRHLGRRDQRHHAGGVRRQFQPRRGQPARGVGEHALPPRLPHRRVEHHAPRPALARRDVLAVAPEPDLAARQRAARAKCCERTLAFERIQDHIDSGALYAVSVTASGYTTGQSVSFFQGGSGLEGWERNQRIGAAVSLKLEYLLASSALPFIFPGGQGEPRVFRRRLGAPDRADQPGAAPGRRPRAGGRHRPPEHRPVARALQHLSVARAGRRPRAQLDLPRRPVGGPRAPGAHQPHRRA